jgi:predicted MPP superfamily phosphohydrolase
LSLVVEALKVTVRGLPEGLDGFKIVALSDFHLYPFTELPFIQRAIEIARGLNPDLVVLLGDFVDATAETIHELAPALGALNSRHGIFAVLGNHDIRKGPAVVARALRSAGMEVLVNRAVEIGAGRSYLRVAGVDSLLGRPDLGAALRGEKEGVPTVLLAHEPDIADSVAQHGRVDLQLSGHSHGGQVRLPLFQSLSLPRWGRKYPFGRYQVGDMALYTGRGLGTTGVPIRIGSVPEVSEITLVCGEPGIQA